MSAIQFVIVAMVAAIVTLPIVKFIPRVRQSPLFDSVLWGATWLLSFLCAWYMVGNLATGVPLATLSLDEFARVAGSSLVIGAVGGALAVNALLWLMDRFFGLEIEETGEEELPAEVAEEAKGDQAKPESHEAEEEPVKPESQ